MITTATVYPCSVRDAMAHWPTGLAVVTTADRDGWWWGFTAHGVSHVSDRPPMVSVCLDRDARCRPVFTAVDAFAVHVLRAGQETLASRFADGSADDFDGIAVECGFEDVPLLSDVALRLECRPAGAVPAGDHVLLLGEVVRARTGPHEPLIYLDNGVRRLARPDRAA
ncbi:MAG: flavin reductase [Actinophytocola sp.]|uniref:flavin reductase family protein n=1 Tax=Actinophytocola sp. TaxID=1872138 RepID=UPI001322B451|nr:flavin reductase family protein [Actinophytocola sp.]MPZ84153.1 flavin reductase [Actinophytocola sp.]